MRKYTEICVSAEAALPGRVGSHQVQGNHFRTVVFCKDSLIYIHVTNLAFPLVPCAEGTK